MNATTPTQTDKPAAKRRVLVVEDNQFTAALYQKVLEREGFDVVHIANGRNAFEAILDQRFDLVMLDLMLPEMDGLEILKRVHDCDAEFQTPVVVLSEVELAAVREQVREYGVKQYLTKTGADALKIVEAVKTLVTEATAAPPADATGAPGVTHDIDPKLVNLDMMPAAPIEVRKLTQVFSDVAISGPYHYGDHRGKHKPRQSRPLVTSLRRFLLLW